MEAMERDDRVSWVDSMVVEVPVEGRFWAGLFGISGVQTAVIGEDLGSRPRSYTCTCLNGQVVNSAKTPPQCDVRSRLFASRLVPKPKHWDNPWRACEKQVAMVGKQDDLGPDWKLDNW